MNYPKWMIVSGYHGLLAPSELVDPYEINLDASGFMTRWLWLVRLIFQLSNLIGWRAPAFVEVRARGLYLSYTCRALRILGFQFHVPASSEGVIILIRGTMYDS